MTPDPIATDKRTESFLELYKQQIERFRQTQEVEWKANIGVWTLLAGAIYLTKDRPVGISPCFAGLGAALILILHGGWLYKIHKSQEADKELWVRYRGEALSLLRHNGALLSHETYTPRTWRKELSWLLLEIGVTGLLAVLFALQQR